MSSIVGSVVLEEIWDKFLINVHKDFKILPFSQNVSDRRRIYPLWQYRSSNELQVASMVTLHAVHVNSNQVM